MTRVREFLVSQAQQPRLDGREQRVVRAAELAPGENLRGELRGWRLGDGFFFKLRRVARRRRGRRRAAVGGALFGGALVGGALVARNLLFCTLGTLVRVSVTFVFALTIARSRYRSTYSSM